jgi:hypothetical protein
MVAWKESEIIVMWSSSAVLIDCDAINLLKPYACLRQAIGHPFRWKSGPMLGSFESLFLGCRNEHTIAHKRFR